MVSVNVNSKEFLQTESTESKELQGRVGQLRLQWDAAQGAVESWRDSLRQSLMQCQVRRRSWCPRPRPTWVGEADIFIILRLLWHSQIWLVLGNVGSTICLQRSPPAVSEP